MTISYQCILYLYSPCLNHLRYTITLVKHQISASFSLSTIQNRKQINKHGVQFKVPMRLGGYCAYSYFNMLFHVCLTYPRGLLFSEEGNLGERGYGGTGSSRGRGNSSEYVMHGRKTNQKKEETSMGVLSIHIENSILLFKSTAMQWKEEEEKHPLGLEQPGMQS